MLVWSPADLMDSIEQGFLQREESLRQEQAVYGLDAIEETAFHPLIAGALSRASHPVVREAVYPGSRRRSSRAPVPTMPDDPERGGATTEPGPAETPAVDTAGSDPALDRERERCDIVVLPAGFTRIADPISRRRAARTIRREAEGTLFEPTATRDSAVIEHARAADACPPEDAFWLEVKVVGQHAYCSGVPGPNRAYASQLSRGVISDLIKLRADRHLRHAGVLLVLFSEDPTTAEHDLGVLLHRCLDRDLPIWSAERRSLAILDRIGNRVCTLALIPIRPGGGDD